MENKLWKFTDNSGSFESNLADKIKSLYFPLANDNLMSSITPDLHGDVKTGENSFLLTPVSRIDLTDSRSSRNFWVHIGKDIAWSCTGVSKDLKQIKEDKFKLRAGFLWHKVTRENKRIGLGAEILSFVPATGEPVEIMQVKITNLSKKSLAFTPFAAIPVYARGANNLRDHRHVTSLLQRITIDKFGVIVKPTLSFNESGHKPNKINYFVFGCDEKRTAPEYVYPTREIFSGDAGDLEAPLSVLNNLPPDNSKPIQGREAMGALRFAKASLTPGRSRTYIIIMGAAEEKAQIKSVFNKFNAPGKVQAALEKTKDYWLTSGRRVNLRTGDTDFDNWLRWVSIQPGLRKIFGCSFLPDFDYGKGGRGWRDLWQDCLSLILDNPGGVRRLLINNFSGVRIDGSNATIIGKKPGEFLSDRNNISRVWTDHGVWPLLALDLYLEETGDFNILFEEAPYFRNHEISRSAGRDNNWSPEEGQQLRAASGRVYRGTILEHLLVQNLVQFFNVGRHNHLRLEGADWNDGLDMAGENGESVTFGAMYAYNLGRIADLLSGSDVSRIKVAKELKLLLGRVNYSNIRAKRGLLAQYFSRTNRGVSGEKISLDKESLIRDLKIKSEWMRQNILKKEWLKQGFFNGYYDNKGERIDGLKDGLLRMTLASQVFPVMSGVAGDRQIARITENARRYLQDKNLNGFHLNTDFIKEQHNFGRAFSFIYGDKENGAFFNHMTVMFAYGLYKRGFVREGWEALSSIYKMAMDTACSKIYPCLPEYFDISGRGMYSYLTGSASWFILTMITQVLGIKGREGNLFIEPKFSGGQFKCSPLISADRIFAGRKLRINFFNPGKLDYGKYSIVKASLNKHDLPLDGCPGILIDRRTILGLPKNKLNIFNINLG